MRVHGAFRESQPHAAVIKHGNAIEPYRVVEREAFHTEFAALLFARMRCPQLDQYHYWTVERPSSFPRPFGLNPPSKE